MHTNQRTTEVAPRASWPACLGAALFVATGMASQAAITGQWDFDNGNLNATTGGKPLEYADGAGAETQAATRFGTTTSFGIPNIGGTEAKVMKFGTNTIPAGYSMPAPAAGNGGGGQVNQWTLVADVLFPAESNGRWRAIIECDGGLTPDAEAFVNTGNGLGLGSYGGTIQANTWHRIAIVADLPADQLRFYIDGAQVLSRNGGGASAIDGRWALATGGVATLFADDNGETAGGYVNSLQLHNVALSKGQILALGGATAAGLPGTLPPVPSSLENWIPAGAFASRTTSIGAVINPGDATIQDGSISLTLDGAAVASPTITRPGGLIRVEKTNPGLSLGKHKLVLAYTDSQVGAKSLNTEFTAALFFEDFESLALGPNKDEALVSDKAWTNKPPTGWTVDNTKFDATIINDENPDGDGDGFADRDGITEWAGWSFASRDWWAQTAGDQRRTEFVLGAGNVAIADPDEWDDTEHAVSLFNSLLTTPSISIEGLAANTITLAFASSWRPEGRDDANTSKFPVDENGAAINNQTAVITASFDGGAPVQLLKWDSINGSPTFHTDMPNESVLLTVPNPAGAKKMVLTFALLEGANDWWWAIDNIAVSAGSAPPTVGTQPKSITRYVGTAASFTVQGTGVQLSYQWQKDGANIPNATSSTYDISLVAAGDAGKYRAVIKNDAGSVTSDEATLTVNPLPTDLSSLKTALAVYLPFDGNFSDASGNRHDGTAVGSPENAAGLLGTGAVRVKSSRSAQTFNFVTLGSAADLPFGETKDFTVSYWMKTERVDGDPGLVATKNWGSGGNTGWSIGTQTDGRLEWNYRRAGDGLSRKDLDAAGMGLAANVWKHVTVAWSINGDAHSFVDGIEIDVRTIAPGTGTLIPEGLSLNIGQDGTGAYTDGEWDGLIDDFAIWDRALNAGEVAAIYGNGRNGTSLGNIGTSTPSTLTIARGQAGLTIAWTGSGKLQSASNVAGPYADVAGATSPATVQPTAAAAFYRVKQ